MTKLEEVARAIWEARRKFAATLAPECPLEEFGDGSIPRANGVFGEARAAIEAMREPSPAMKYEMFGDGRIALDAWRKTVDTALKDQP